MLDTGFMHTAASVSAPALLTNASALLLGGANHRHQLAIAAREGLRHNAESSPTRRNASIRATLSAAAVHSFHMALLAFGIDCVLLLSMTVIGPYMNSLLSSLDIAGTTLSFVGLAALLVGVILMASESLYGMQSTSL